MWVHGLIYGLPILSGVDEASSFLTTFFFFFYMAPKGKSLACPLLVTLLRQRRRCSFKCFTLVIHSLFFPLLSVESLSPFPILFSHSVFAVCCNGPLGKFWRLHTKDNKNNWSKSQQMKLNRQRWMVFMRVGVCVCLCASVCVLYKVHIDLKQMSVTCCLLF